MKTQVFGNLLRDVFLERKDIGDFAIVLLAPQLRTFLSLDQLGLHNQGIAALENTARHNCTHIQFSPNLLQVFVVPLVLKCSIACRPAQAVKLGPIIDQAYGDSIAKVFGVGIATGVDEGQHGERIDAFAGVKVGGRKPHQDSHGHTKNPGDYWPSLPPWRESRDYQSSANRSRLTRFGVAPQSLEISLNIGCMLIS